MSISGSGLGGSTRAASLEVDVKATGLDKAEKELGGFGDKMGAGIKRGAGIAATALATIGVAAGAGIVKAIGAASDLNETISKSNTVFGKNASAIEQWANGAAKSLGQSKQQALDAASSFGNLFVQLGIGSDQAAKMSMEMTGLASDFASFHNADITEVINAQTAAFRGEYDSLQKFVPTINAAAVEQKALEMGLGATTKELDAQDKALATQALMMEGAGDAMGDFARTSDGLANSQRILSAQWDDAVAKLGQAFLPIAQKVVGFLSNTMMPIINEIAGGIMAFGAAWRAAMKGDADVTSNGFPGMMERLANQLVYFWAMWTAGWDGMKNDFVADVSGMARYILIFADYLGGLAARFGILREYIKQFGFSSDQTMKVLAGLIEAIFGINTESTATADALIGIKRVITGMLGGVNKAVEAFGGWGEVAKVLGIALGSAGLAKQVMDVTNAVKNAFTVFDRLKVLMAANPATVWLLAIGALVAAFVYAYQHSEQFRDIIQSVWEFIQTSVIPIAQEFGAQLMTTFTDIWTMVQEVWPGIQESITHVMNVVMDLIGAATMWISEIWDRWGKTIVDTIKVAFNFIQETIQNALQVIQGIIQVVTGIINGDWTSVWNGIKNIFGGVWDQIGNIVSTATGFVRETIQAALGVIDALWDSTFGQLVTVVGSTFSGIKNFVTSGIGDILSAIGGVPGKIASYAVAFANAGVGIGKKLIDGMGQGLSNMAGFVGDVAGGVWKAIKNFVNTNIVDKVRNFHARIDPPGPGVLYDGKPFGSFPRLALGGVFDKPMLAQIAEAGREAVLPLTRPGRMKQILADPSVASAVAAAMPWAKLGASAMASAPRRVDNTGGQTDGDTSALIGTLNVIGSNLSASDVMQAAAWEAHTRAPIKGRRG